MRIQRPKGAVWIAGILGYAASLPVFAQASGYDCVIDPASTSRVASPVRGILDEILVERGDTVRQGQVIARIESSVEASTVALNRVRAENTALVDVEREKMTLAKLTLDRASTLQETDAVSRQELDELQAEFRIQEMELARAEMEQSLAELELGRSEAVLEMRTIRAPNDGVIVERNLSTGEFVREDVHIVTLVQLDPLHVETFLPVERFPDIVKGQTALVEPAAPFEGEYEAAVTVVDPVFDAASNTFGVRLQLQNADSVLPGGLRCQVTFDSTAQSPASASSAAD